MKIPAAFFIVLSLIANSAKSETINSPPGTASELVADILYVNGKIWTGIKGTADASVMAVTDGVITYIGDGKGLNFTATETVSLDGHFIMPGFIDNHVHFFEGGYGLASVDLRNANSPAEFSKRIVNYAKARSSAHRWVLNGNWDHKLWGGKLPHKDWIDKQTAETPVFVIRLDGHMALANSAALKLAGISAATISPSGGEIMLDASGQPTGILKGNALNLVLQVIPKPSDEEVLQAFELAQNHALSLGLTKVHAVTANPTETSMLDDFRLAHRRGEMKIRVLVYTPIEHWRSIQTLIANEGKGDQILAWGGVKGFVDGSLGAGTAWFHAPYSDTPDQSGAPLTEPDELGTLMNQANAVGLDLAIHAIGDKAIDTLLTTMLNFADKDIASKRLRIEHFQHPTAGAIKIAAQNNIIAAMQPYHAIDDGRWAEERVGPQRIKTTYAFRTILDAGVHLSFGSDWPVAPLSPLQGVYAAVTRRTLDSANPEGWQPQEKITVEEALRAYTATNAYAGFDEDAGGTLAKGKRADLVILSQDPRKVDPKVIPQIKVLATIISGELMYKAQRDPAPNLLQ